MDKALYQHFVHYKRIDPCTKKPVYRCRDPEKDSDSDDSMCLCGLKPRKTNSGIRKARNGAPKSSTRVLWHQHASRISRVSTTELSKPLAQVAALARFVAAAVRYGKSDHTRDSVHKVVPVVPSPLTDKGVTNTVLGQIYRDIDDAWLSGIAHKTLGTVHQVIGEPTLLIDPRMCSG
ncbi:MAG: hypothetical protein L6R35_001978 [Caloplaca aegaea]|nr:MAG: hypothetical protein L6R35_001978 [Caloplaca aegaea]